MQPWWRTTLIGDAGILNYSIVILTKLAPRDGVFKVWFPGTSAFESSMELVDDANSWSSCHNLLKKVLELTCISHHLRPFNRKVNTAYLQSSKKNVPCLELFISVGADPSQMLVRARLMTSIRAARSHLSQCCSF